MFYLDADFFLRQRSIAGYMTEDETKRCAKETLKNRTPPTRMINLDNFEYLLK